MDDKQLVGGWAWLKAHERVVMLALILAFGLFLGNKWINHAAAVAHDQAVVAQQVAKEAADQNAKLAAQVAQQTAQYEQERAQRDRETQMLLAAIASRDAAAAKKAADVSAPKTAQEAVDDLSNTYTLRKPVTVTATGADVPTEDLQQFTLTKIERDTYQADLKDTEKDRDGAKADAEQARALVNGLQSQVTGLKDQITKDDNACTKEKNDLKAEARKGKVKWFVGGFVVGITTRIGAKALAFVSGL